MSMRLGILFGLMTFSLPLMAYEKQQVKVQIVAPTEDRSVAYHGTGLIGAIQGTKTADVVFMVNAVVNGDHARLKCYENHRGCTALGPGEYDAEVEKDNVWVVTLKPVTHAVIRDHWKVSGSW